MEHVWSTFSKTPGYGARILLLEHAVVPLNKEMKSGEKCVPSPYWILSYFLSKLASLAVLPDSNHQEMQKLASCKILKIRLFR